MSIKREQHEWGVRLTVHPFADLPANSEMFIQAEVRGTAVKMWFSGTVVQAPLKRSDMLVWMDSLRKVFDAALAEARR
jgi:hypothetical protein